MLTTMSKSYSELRRLRTYEERFEYLKLGGAVGRITFGFDRYLNQGFYGSREWQQIRRDVIIRDNGCDLGIDGYEIHHELLVHHMNPASSNDILQKADWLLDPEYLITTTHRTHNAIHYANDSMLPRVTIARQPGDTKLW